MAQELKTVECLLRIENPNINFSRDIKVNLNPESLEDDSWDFQDIYSGASQTLLQKYLPQMQDTFTKVSLLRPITVDREEFTKFLEDADTNKAKADIDAILSALPEEKRIKVLNQLTR